ncbi:MAG: indole-3-glycerol phosphate synthase TrpC [Bacteroidaceae bacterium]
MKQDILTEIIANKRFEVDRQKTIYSLRELEDMMQDHMPQIRSMKQSIAASSSGIIAEFKRRSPSKGWIHRDANPVDIIPYYALNGASALSILTDEVFFGGTLSDIRNVRQEVNIPILRKEFIIDEYQVYQSRAIEADAILLIAAALSMKKCDELIQLAHQLGLEVLLELHDESEIPYASLGADMIGINNRNLGSFHTDSEHSFDIVKKLPQESFLISESGLKDAETIVRLREVGYKGFLMGEAFMKESNPPLALKQLIQEITTKK